MTDNRTNEPSHNRITIRAFRDGEVSIIHEDQVLGLACTLDELKRAVATYEARGALEAAARAAQGAAPPVNSFDTTAEREKTGADSLHVAPQEPNQTETKSGNNFVSLDPEKVAEVLPRYEKRN